MVTARGLKMIFRKMENSFQILDKPAHYQLIWDCSTMDRFLRSFRYGALGRSLFIHFVTSVLIYKFFHLREAEDCYKLELFLG